MGERQTIWGWKIALYLFLAGGSAGAYLTGVIGEFASRAGDWDIIVKAGVTIGAPLVAFSTVLLVWDLGRPFGFYRAGFHGRTSWISRGVYILTAFILIGLIHLALVWAEAPEGVLRGLGIVGGALAVMTMVYTGLLLGSVRAVPFWNSPALPLLFLVSAMSAGVMAVSLIVAVHDYLQDEANAFALASEGPARSLIIADAILLPMEAAVVMSYLYLVRASSAAKASVEALLGGGLSVYFWVGFVILGLVYPLGIELVLLDTMDNFEPGERLTVTAVGMVPGLAGGYVLRHLIMAAAIKGPLVVIGRLVPVPGRPRLFP